MRLQKYFWNRKIRNGWKKIRRRKVELMFSGVICLVVIYFMNQKPSKEFSYCMPIDVVYTWVNGSDDAFIESVRQYDSSFDPARFDDKEELRYSLRSLEKYAPFVRHVYIVTNGQIPHWLDLSYGGVTIVPHEVLAPHKEWLPTFSSAAIETFLHRIPNLSQRFLYMNDDIFLGAPLYPEDLYTDSEGVQIYQAWMVPDCAEDCPWTYIGDGACDNHCNIAACQYDGGDCAHKDDASNDVNYMQPEWEMTKIKQNENDTKPLGELIDKISMKRKFKFPKKLSPSFKEIMRLKNISLFNNLPDIVNVFNNHKIHNNQASPQSTDQPHENGHLDGYKSTKDIYSQSLINTNMLLNRHYGFKARNVPAHSGFLLDRTIIEEMQEKFKSEIQNTASHRFRDPKDLQLSFAYYTYMISEMQMVAVEEIFDEFDTDGSQTWSDREVRTFLTRIFDPPLHWNALTYFDEVASNCSRDLGLDKRKENVIYSTLVYERYEHSTLPIISRDLVTNCPRLVAALKYNFGFRNKYKFNLNSKRNNHNNFMMLISNVTAVVDELDKLRRNPKKFNCINDNLTPQPDGVEHNEFIRHLLEDFYLSFFPRRSKYELSPQYRNRFANWNDYQRWRIRKRGILVFGYTASAILLIFVCRFLCTHKAKFVSRYI